MSKSIFETATQTTLKVIDDANHAIYEKIAKTGGFFSKLAKNFVHDIKANELNRQAAESEQKTHHARTRGASHRSVPTYKVRVGYRNHELIVQAIENVEATLKQMLQTELDSDQAAMLRRGRYFLKAAEDAYQAVVNNRGMRDGHYMFIYSGDPATSTYMTLEFHHASNPRAVADRAVFRVA